MMFNFNIFYVTILLVDKKHSKPAIGKDIKQKCPSDKSEGHIIYLDNYLHFLTYLSLAFSLG